MLYEVITECCNPETDRLGWGGIHTESGSTLAQSWGGGKTLLPTHTHGNCMTILTLLFNEKKLQDYELAYGRQLTIGRSPDNDIIIDNPAVSGRHARVESVVSSFA